MSAMHHDTSSDLKVVGEKLKDILEVNIVAFGLLPRKQMLLFIYVFTL